MTNSHVKTDAYVGIGTHEKQHPSVPILVSGIGTRIGKAADLIGTRRFVADVIGVSPAALQRYIAEENMPAFDFVARLCAAAGVRMEWIAFDTGAMKAAENAEQTASESHSQSVNEEVMTIAIELVQEAVAKRREPLDPKLHAELIRHVYDLLIAPGPLPTATITQLVRAASNTGVVGNAMQDHENPRGSRKRGSTGSS